MTPATMAAAMPRGDYSRGAARAAVSPTPMTVSPAPDPVSEGSAPARAIHRFEDLVALAAEMRDLQTKGVLERDVRLVRCEDGRLEIALEPGAQKTQIGDLGRKFSQWTGRRWMVVVSAEKGQPTIKSQRDAKREENERGVLADPLVQAVLDKFPGAKIVDVRARDAAIEAPIMGNDDTSDDDGPPAYFDDEPPFEDR
jgi:DNA polymerase-3 subunit gamma/tau